MENAPRLYDAVLQMLGQHPHWRDKRHLQTLVWMVVGLILSSQINLTAWVDYVWSRAVFAQSVQRRFSRWLSNDRIEERVLYAPIIRQALAQWQTQRLVLALDTSLLWNRYCLIRIALVYRGRAIPVMWSVKEHASSAVAHEDYAVLLEEAAKVFPPGVEVLFLADRGFADVALMQHLKQLQWHYHIRIKSNFSVYLGKRRQQMSDYRLRAGEAVFLHSVRLTKARFGLVHVALAQHQENGERWFVVSDEPTSTQTFVEYGFRFDIEEGFLDDKSNGFQLESSQIRSAPMLSRLGLVLAIATLYLSVTGTEVVARGDRRRVDPHWFRGSSYLKIGWSWVRQALVWGWQIPDSLKLSYHPDPVPAIASRKQNRNRNKPLKFQTTTIDASHSQLRPTQTRESKAA